MGDFEFTPLEQGWSDTSVFAHASSVDCAITEIHPQASVRPSSGMVQMPTMLKPRSKSFCKPDTGKLARTSQAEVSTSGPWIQISYSVHNS